jgi:hypothetical protein
MMEKRREEPKEKRKLCFGQPAKEFIWPIAVPSYVMKALPWLRDNARGDRAKVPNWQHLIRDLKNSGIITVHILRGIDKNYWLEV